ncbi:hypothetical protein ACLOJK_026373 [Asimina triloba]
MNGSLISPPVRQPNDQAISDNYSSTDRYSLFRYFNMPRHKNFRAICNGRVSSTTPEQTTISFILGKKRSFFSDAEVGSRNGGKSSSSLKNPLLSSLSTFLQSNPTVLPFALWYSAIAGFGFYGFFGGSVFNGEDLSLVDRSGSFSAFVSVFSGEMASGGIFSISMASVVEDVLQQHGTSLKDVDLASRKAEEAASRRYEAAGWLRKMIGFVGAKDLPSEPSEEEFRLGLRNGIILCNVLNKVHPGGVPKVVEAPVDSVVPPDGAALSAFQYFENVRNFLVAVQELGLPTFEASDLEQKGKGARVVNCVLGLKSYTEWKQTEPFTNSLSRTSSMNEKSLNGDLSQESSEMPVHMLVRAALSDKKPEEVPTLVESMLNKVMEEFERRLASQNELVKTALNDLAASGGNRSTPQTINSSKIKMEVKDVNATQIRNEGCFHVKSADDEESKRKLLKQQSLFEQQQRDIQELKQTLHITKAGMQFMQMKNAEEFCNLDEVFSDTRPLIRSVLDGYNVCIFAYGQTGSGKTYTMTGPKDLTEQSKGVNYRALSDLFQLSEQRRDTFCYDVAVQMIEIYNEQVRDLLKGLNVPDANLVPVTSTSDVIELMNIGQRNRVVGATALNDRSSRSHSCLTVHIQGRDLTSGNILRGCMHLVDLAGSERVDKSEVTGDRLKEAQHINKSLSALGDVIAALAQKSPHVPYRNSKLTQLLQDSLASAAKASHGCEAEQPSGGQAKTLMFVHISPETDALGETISTLKFAERVATVELGAARINKESGDVRDLKEQISQLKAALARKEGESELLQNTPLTPEIHGRKAAGPSPLHSNRQLGEDMSSGHCSHRMPMEDVGNIEVRSNSTMRQKKPSFDLQELLMSTNSPPWPDNSPRVYSQKGDDKDVVSGDWVDKIMVNKQEASHGGENLLGRWDSSNGPLPDFFYQSCLPDMRVFPDQQYNKLGNRKDGCEYETTMTDDSDELEMGTSDSSEADLFWQFNVPKVSSVTHGHGGVSRIKKPQARSANSPELRNASQANGPSHSRKPSNGGGLLLNRTVRQPVSSGLDGKRFTSNGKTGNVK